MKDCLVNKKYIRYPPKEGILNKLEQAIDSQVPITIVIGFGYHKNPNACKNLLPDIAEETAIQQLVNYATSIEKVYSPGMKIKIITSGRRAEIVNGMNHQDTIAYYEALISMVKQNNWERIIEIIPLGNLYDEFYEDFQTSLEKVRKQVKPDWNDTFWTQQAEHAKRNMRQEGLSEKEIVEKSREAAWKYVIYHRAEIEAELLEKKFPGAIRASYNRHEESLVFWTTAKGSVTQPWQGRGERDSNGRIIVITQKRKKEESVKLKEER